MIPSKTLTASAGIKLTDLAGIKKTMGHDVISEELSPTSKEFEGLLKLKYQTTPNEYARFLKKFGGRIHYWESNDVWVVTDYELGKSLLKSPDFSADRGAFFISRMPDMDLSLISDFFSVVQKMMVMSDAQEHTRRRRVVQMGLGDRLMELYRHVIPETLDELLAPLRKTGATEFVSEVALQLPSRILAHLFNIPDSERPEFYKCSNQMTQFFGGASAYQNEDGRAVNACALYLKNFFETQIVNRRTNPSAYSPTDFLLNLVQDASDLTTEEIVSQAIMMLVAGSVTTTDQICNNLYTLLTEPGIFKELAIDRRSRAYNDGQSRECQVSGPGDPKLELAIEEFNRLDPGVSYLFRVAKKDLEILGQKIRQGQTVFISNHAVNRDPKTFVDPETCRLDRVENPHFAYGHGPHFCLGAKLARLQMSHLFSILIREFPNLRLDPALPARRRHYSLAFSGFERLNLLST